MRAVVEDSFYDFYSTGELTANLRIMPFVTRIAGVQGQSRLNARYIGLCTHFLVNVGAGRVWICKELQVP